MHSIGRKRHMEFCDSMKETGIYSFLRCEEEILHFSPQPAKNAPFKLKKFQGMEISIF